MRKQDRMFGFMGQSFTIMFFFDDDSPVCIYMIKNSAVLGLRKVMGSLSLEILKLSDIDLL